MILAAAPQPLLTGFGVAPAASTAARLISFSNGRRKRGDPFRISCVLKDVDKGHLEGSDQHSIRNYSRFIFSSNCDLHLLWQRTIQQQTGLCHSTHQGERADNTNHPNHNLVTCQICEKLGHSALICWHRTNLDYLAPTITQNQIAYDVDNQSQHFVALSKTDWQSQRGTEVSRQRTQFYIWVSSKRQSSEQIKGFSVLSNDFPWDVESTWSTFAAYFFILHVPLSFGVLPMIARALHQSFHDPVITAASALMLQGTELTGFLALLYYTANNRNKLPNFFLGTSYSEQRNWLMASASGIGFLILLVLLTSILADILIGPKDFNNPILKEILLYSPISKTTCFFLYCFVTPLLEEAVYRGFLLTSIASGKKFWQAICISSFAFSLAHFSLENSVQLFFIGCVLGSVYCWSGKLVASVTVHSVYNLMILLFICIS